MTLKFHNTLTGQVDDFISIKENEVSIYTCGPTVYNYPHVGNWAAFIYWDVLIRILTANNFNVIRVLNVTDVGHLTSDADSGEDKLEKSAVREGKTAWEIAKFYTDDFLLGMNKLNLIIPQTIAKVTDYIPQQLDLVLKLKEKGFTYQISDGIYFDTSKFPSYADFAHLNLKALMVGTRLEYNPEKRNHSDFALWKFTPKNTKRDMEWETPNDLLEPNDTNQPTMGFPGWHLECSAIIMSLLGETIDIHTGGIDAIPVHHTNEIAQTESITGLPLSNFWLHNNFMKVNGTKISKSLGNGYTLEDLEKHGYSPLDFRMFVLQGHYRNEGNFTFDNLKSAKNRLNNWRNAAALRHQIHDTLINDNEKITDIDTVALYAPSKLLVETINNDLNTPEALRIIDESFSKVINTNLEGIYRQAFIKLLETVDSLLGLELINSTPDISDEAKQIILARKQARTQKDWAISDKLRDQLSSLNIEIKDTDKDSIWQYKF